jgi:hypothetical protein
MGNNKPEKIVYESVKLNKEVVDLVRDNKKSTFVPISIFFENAAKKELQKSKKQ